LLHTCGRQCQFQEWIIILPNVINIPVSVLTTTLSLLCCLPVSVSAQQLSKTAAPERALPATSTPASSINVLQRAGFSGDSDGDSIPDIIDVDDDNDTIPDDVEGTSDTDLDGVPDCLDIDSDNDGITDLFEAVAGSGLSLLVDADRDGKLDAFVTVGENGLADVVEHSAESSTSKTGNADLDGDGVRDHQDLDVDNDGIPDVVEAGSSDNMFDGLYDFFLDLNGDGLADRLLTSPIVPRDSDQDGIEDFRDLDTDEDGLTDRLETFGTDTDSDGHVDNLVDANLDGLDDGYQARAVAAPDTDNDGFPDHRDIDSDGDGVTDSEEAFGGAASGMSINSTTLFKPQPGVQNDEVLLQTGQSGNVFGCTLSTGNAIRQANDPMFLLLLCASVLILLGRHSVFVAAKCGSAITRRLSLPAIASVAMLSGCAIPQVGKPLNATDARQPYAGVGVGGSSLDADTSNLPFDQDKSTGLAAQLTLGVALGERLGFEVRAADLGEATFTSGGAVGYQVADVSALYKRQFGKYLGFARLGAGALFNDGDIRTTQKNKTHILVGLGAQYALNPRVALRAEWQGHDADVMHSQFSVIYRFGARSGANNPVIIANNRVETTNRQRLSNAEFQRVPKKGDEAIALVSANDAPEQPAEEVAATVKPKETAEAKPAPKKTKPKPKAKPKPEASEPKSVKPESNTTVENAEPILVADKPAIEPGAAEPNASETKLAAATTAENDGNEQATPSESEEQASSIETSDEALDETADQQLAALTTQDKPNEMTAAQPDVASTQTDNSTTLVDLDNDGVEDTDDKCPETQVDQVVLADGCSLFEDSVAGLTFVSETDRLTHAGEQVLDTVANELTSEPALRVTVAVHTAPSDDSNAAMFLTRRRTIAIIRYLSDKGIDTTRLRPEAYGDTQPLVDAQNPSDNERVVFSTR